MDKEKFLAELKQRVFIIDGAMGTTLQALGFKEGCPEELNLKDPDMIKLVHIGYKDAGAEMIVTNTFGANRLKLEHYKLQDKVKEINEAAVKIVKESCPGCIVFGEIAPTGHYIEPLGDLTFEKAYEVFKEQAEALHEADVISLSTFADIKELKAAIIAVKHTYQDKPVLAQMTFESDRTPTGTDIKTFVAVAEALGVDIIGTNCSAGPKGMYKNVKVMAKLTKKPLSIWPNAGLPQMIDGKTVFPATPKEMAKYAKKFWKLGVNIIGGCCGSNKEHIKAIADKVKGKKTKKRKVKETSYLCSRTKTLEIDKETLIVGERINPTGRKEFREEIKQGKTALIRTEALQQVKEGAELLDINVGVAGINETEMLKKAVSLVQSTVNVPIVIDTSDVKALEESLKLSDGKALINSVNGKEDSLNTVLALAKKYGAAIIGLTLDKEGIPKTKEKRLKIAKKIIKRALEIGIDKNDIYIDCLTMTIATNPENEKILLDCVKEIKAMGYKTILGVSNISHGLPNRSLINSKFYTKASKAGLNLAILNPLDKTKQKKTDIQDFAKVKIEKKDYSKLPLEKQLYNAILYGDEDGIAAIVDKALASMKALQINEILVSALSEVGDKFKCKEYFLPNVLLSASTMKKAFSRLKEEFKKTGQKHKAKVLFATVKDDVHDIGKNIVIALIESNNYQVVDLGKDVSTEAIIEAVKKHKIDIVCLSALMTTTAPYMKEVIKKLDIEKIKIPVLIGGAVITEDYAKGIGAFYAKDAISAVKKLGEIIDHN